MSLDSVSAPPPVIVIGAGVAGLTCAAGIHQGGGAVLVFEASDGVGGRVRTHRHPDGFLIDHGFQVILDAYPAIGRRIDVPSLNGQSFDAGAMIWTGRRAVPVADPLRHPASSLRNLTTSIFSFSDKARLAKFALKARTATWESANEAAKTEGLNQSAAQALQSAGFSKEFVDRFARPFWGGISLDPTLGGSDGPLKFTLKMFLQGTAVLPAFGVQAVPDQLAAQLPVGSMRLNRKVDEIMVENGRAIGVIAGGTQYRASAVVVAIDPPAAKRMTGIGSLPDVGVGCVTVFLRGRRNPGIGKRLLLDGTGRRSVNHIAPLSNVQPAYAPPGEHLIAAVLLGVAPLAGPFDDRIGQKAINDAATMLGHVTSDWSVLEIVRTPFAQFAQPPGVHLTLPSVRTSTPGLFLATEATVDSSLNGAIISGEHAARAVLAATR